MAADRGIRHDVEMSLVDTVAPFQPSEPAVNDFRDGCVGADRMCRGLQSPLKRGWSAGVAKARRVFSIPGGGRMI